MPAKRAADRLTAIRAAYAGQLMRQAGSDNRRLRDAFAFVAREDHLPAPPWKTLSWGRQAEAATGDAAALYRNVLVVIDPARGINNGEPLLHASWMAAVDVKAGETVCQIGAGTGYYTAILAELAGVSGRVIAWEIEPDLAAMAAENLAARVNVDVVAGDASAAAIAPCDVLYVNAGVRCPPLAWLFALKPGGRLIFPWRPTVEVALTLLVVRAVSGFAARPLMGASFIPLGGIGARPDMRLAPEAKSALRIRSLVLSADRMPDRTAVAIFDDLWFSTADPGKPGSG
jgi:protein-L-isoaspartate(D-aspartate) O-methyltransferase